MSQIVTSNSSIIKIGINGPTSTPEDMIEALNFLSGEYKDDPTTQESKIKGSVTAINTVTYHSITGSGTWQRTKDCPVQLYMLKLSEEIAGDCKTKVEFIGEDGVTRTGIFNVSATEVGFSGAADELATLEVSFTLAEGTVTTTYPTEVSDALTALQTQ